MTLKIKKVEKIEAYRCPDCHKIFNPWDYVKQTVSCVCPGSGVWAWNGNTWVWIKPEDIK